MKLEEIIKPKIIAEILGITINGVYAKLKKRESNKFSEDDLKKIKEKVIEVTQK